MRAQLFRAAVIVALSFVEAGTVTSCAESGALTSGSPTADGSAPRTSADGSTADGNETSEEIDETRPALVRMFLGLDAAPFCLSRGTAPRITIPQAFQSMSAYFEIPDDHVDVFSGEFNGTSCVGPRVATFPINKGRKYLIVPYQDSSGSKVAIFPDDPKGDPAALRVRLINLTEGFDGPASVFIANLTGVKGQSPPVDPLLADVPYAAAGGTSSYGPVVDGFVHVDQDFKNLYVSVYGRSSNVGRLYVVGPQASYMRGERYTILQNGSARTGNYQPETYLCPDLDTIGTDGTELEECVGQRPNKVNE